ncbi:hypothetical protein KIN20_037452 [Parelaphostrongylus tenuis]|nr:hypothetical protein KIN20_037452 [Parelaphostrongylus tenuis]
MSPDDIILAVGTDSTLQLYDIRTRCILKQFSSSTHGATFHPTQRMVATYGSERVVRFWCLDELLSVAMSDVFPAEIQCAEFVTVSPERDPVLVVATDQILKTLTSEPCETLATNTIGDASKVLSLNVAADGVGVICTDSTSALSYSVFSMKEVLHGSTESIELSDTDESISDEMTADEMPEISSPEKPLSSIVPSVPVPMHVSSSDGRIGHAQDGGVGQANISVRSSSTDGSSFTQRFRTQRGKIERRTDANRSLTIRPRSPSMPSVQSNNDQQQLGRTRKSCTSRLNSRSASPSNCATVKEIPVTVLRPNERNLRPEACGKPPREPIRSIQTNSQISTAGLSINDFVAKIGKEHHITVMQADRTALGVQQLTATFRHGGMSGMLKDSLFADELVVTAILKILNEKKLWDINICNIYLQKLKEFLLDSTLPESCRQVALSSLQCIATDLLGVIRSCSRAPLCNIGVDVAAEDRKQKAENCITELRDLRDRRDQFYRKLSQDDVYRLDAIIAFLKAL